MLLSRQEATLGVHPQILRQTARTLDGPFTLQAFAQESGIGMEESFRVLSQMQQLGWVQPCELPAGEAANEQFFRGTVEWGRLAAARIGKPLKRSKADTLVERLKADAQALNHALEPGYALVSELWLFGSYLTDKAELGDLDVMVELAAPLGESLTRKPARGSSLATKTFEFLRKSSPYVSLTSYSYSLRFMDTARVPLYRVEEDYNLWLADDLARTRFPHEFLRCAKAWLGQKEVPAEVKALCTAETLSKYVKQAQAQVKPLAQCFN